MKCWTTGCEIQDTTNVYYEISRIIDMIPTCFVIFHVAWSSDDCARFIPPI